MGRRDKPLIDEVASFVKHHQGDKGCFAPFTGQDYPAWCAFVHLVQCWTRGGGNDAIVAMRATVRCAQPSVLHLFVQAIPAVGDWCHVAQLWPLVAEGIVARDGSDARLLAAIERHMDYDQNDKPLGTRAIHHHGWRSQ